MTLSLIVSHMWLAGSALRAHGRSVSFLGSLKPVLYVRPALDVVVHVSKSRALSWITGASKQELPASSSVSWSLQARGEAPGGFSFPGAVREGVI